MMSTKKYLCWVVVALMFLAVLSGGCGGGSGGSTNTGANNENGNSTPNTETSPEESFDTSIPTTINGTWNVDSGNLDVSTIMNGDNVGGIKATYAKGSTSEVTLEFLSNDEKGIEYTLVITGNDVENHSEHGDVLRVGIIPDEGKSSDHTVLHTGFYSHRTFKRTGLNTFELDATENDIDVGSTTTVKLKITLENSSLRWTELTVSTLTADGLDSKITSLANFVFKR